MRVYIISAYPAVRAGLAALVRAQPGWDVAAAAAPEAAARIAAGDTRHLVPNALDIVLADLDGIAEAETVEAWLAALRPARGLVALGGGRPTPTRGRMDGAAVRLLAEVAHAAGARGTPFGALRRDATEEEIIAALTAVASGLVALDQRLAGELLLAPERTPAPAAERSSETGDPLTPRELEVLQLLAQGVPNKIIALRLGISEHTAKFHVSAILMKLGAASRTEAVTTAARRGLLIL
ncbi:MAG: response regulator transcription factor [Ktedonobacterales bacterium]|nr:response regulator transcription factor [Ktedonobacterales bacterium]